MEQPIEQIVYEMRNSGNTQAEIASEIGVSIAAVSFFLSGKIKRIGQKKQLKVIHNPSRGLINWNGHQKYIKVTGVNLFE